MIGANQTESGPEERRQPSLPEPQEVSLDATL